MVYCTGNNCYGQVDTLIQFTDQSSNSPTGWNWNFGDGQTSTLQNPTHKYAAVGDYIIKHSSTNTCTPGTGTCTDKTISITATPPVQPSGNIPIEYLLLGGLGLAVVGIMITSQPNINRK